MRLCWLTANDRGGGIGPVVHSCCRQAAADGHEVTWLTFETSDKWEELDESFRTVDLGGKDRRTRPCRLVHWLRKNPQDVLILNQCEPVSPALPYLPRNLRCATVIHDTATRYWKPRLSNHEGHLDAIVAVSEVVASQFRDRLTEPEKVSVIHNGTAFPPLENYKGSERANEIMFLGGGKQMKGARDVLPVWEQLVQQGFGGALHWYGDVQNDLQTQVASAAASNRIHLHGYVSRETIFERAARAKALLMLSRVESFGMVTVECMGMGCLPVAWDIETGTTEIIQPGQTGYVAPLGNYEALARNVLRACNEHVTREADVIERARSHFSDAAMWGRYENLIQRMMQNPVATRPKAGEEPPDFEPPTRVFQLLPNQLRRGIRKVVGSSPYLGYLLRNMRGM